MRWKALSINHTVLRISEDMSKNQEDLFWELFMLDSQIDGCNPGSALTIDQSSDSIKHFIE